MSIKYIFAFTFCLLTDILFAQIESNKIFPFLNQSSSGRMNALGGYTLAEISPDINQSFSNPAFYNPDDQFDLSYNHQFLFKGAGVGNLALGKKIKWKDLALWGGIQYAGYGSIDGYDENGIPTGLVKANDYNIIIGASTQLYENLRLGSNIKFITSNLGEYSSNAFAVDLAAAYHVPDGTSTLGFAIKNLGRQITYYESTLEPLPLDIQASGSIRLKHLPLRIGILAHHLNKWNLLYENPYDIEESFSFDDPFAKPDIKQYGLVDNLFRHLVIQAELAIGKNEGFKMRLAYNHMRKRDLTVYGFRSLAGFSGGLGLRIYKFGFDYGMSVYHLAGISHCLTITTDLNTFNRKSL